MHFKYFASASILIVFSRLTSAQFCDPTYDPCYQKVSDYEVRAVLLPCHPHLKHRRCYCGQVAKLQGFDHNVCEQGKLKDCVKKVVIAIRMINMGQTNCQPRHVVVDEVYDCQTDTKQKLLYPYVIKIKQEPLFQTYKLDWESAVRERCRAMEGRRNRRRKYRKRPAPKIPWVQCDNRMTYTIQKLKRDSDEVDDSNFEQNNREAYFGDSFKGDKINPYYIDSNLNRAFNESTKIKYRTVEDYTKEKSKRGKRISFHGHQSPTPFGIDGQKDILSNIQFPMASPTDGYDWFDGMSYVPTDNCYEYCSLRNMKYYIYKLKEPIVKHHFSFEIFEKHNDINGCVQWNSITDGELFLGTYDTDSWGRNESFYAGYTSKEPPLRNFALCYDNVRLLVPQFPYLRGGPERFLVIPESMFIRKADCFGSSGAHYGSREKFVTTCSSIKYPPRWFWCRDLEKERAGYRGNFFLKYFAKLPAAPLHNTSECYKNLTFFYEGPHQSILNVEIKADFNIMLKPHSSAVITEVYVDATNCERTDITVKVTNTGLVYAVFYVFLTDCPLCLPAGFSNIATSSAVIPPQQQHIFAITILFPLPKKKFYCSVDVKNYRHDVLAFRRIRFQKHDRCICIWHCCCTCLDTDKGLKCRPLPIDHYNAAGFYGGLPMATKYIISTSFVEEYMMLMFNLCLTMTVLLLVMGVLKAVLGLCYPSIGRFGLEWYLGLPKSIDKYYESNLKKRPVQYDKLGWPIHPDTKKRCRTTSISVEFSINIVFFLLYPLILLHAVVIKVCTPECASEYNKNYFTTPPKKPSKSLCK